MEFLSCRIEKFEYVHVFVFVILGSSYRIRVKTVSSGTPQSVYIMIYGTNEKKTDWKKLSGNFGPGQITEERYEMENIGQVIKIIIM